MMQHKKKIINNNALSNKEKRQEFLKLKPKCVNCKRPGGTIFSVKSFEINDNSDNNSNQGEYSDDLDYTAREYKAVCSVKTNPCNLNITIQCGIYKSLQELIHYAENDIKITKDNIIDSKNKLLFGYLNTEEALHIFESDKQFVDTITSLLEEYLNTYNQITNDSDKTQDLKKSIELSYIFIENIKESIRLYNDTENLQYIKDIVNLYITNLQPLLRKIMALKYKENFVYYDEKTNTYHLIQNINTIKNLEYLEYFHISDKVVSYDVGYTQKRSSVQQNANPEKEEEGEPKFMLKPSIVKPAIMNKEKQQAPHEKQIRRMPYDEPIYGKGKDGILWNVPEYNIVWDKLPVQLKNVLKTNNEWMKEFMFNCVNAQANGEYCQMVSPPDLKSPPNHTVLPNGQYDFGVPIYNEVYNNLRPIDKQNLLLLSNVDDKGKTVYFDDMFKKIMNQEVARVLGIKLLNPGTLKFDIDESNPKP